MDDIDYSLRKKDNVAKRREKYRPEASDSMCETCIWFRSTIQWGRRFQHCALHNFLIKRYGTCRKWEERT